MYASPRLVVAFAISVFIASTAWAGPKNKERGNPFARLNGPYSGALTLDPAASTSGCLDGVAAARPVRHQVKAKKDGSITVTEKIRGGEGVGETYAGSVLVGSTTAFLVSVSRAEAACQVTTEISYATEKKQAQVRLVETTSCTSPALECKVEYAGALKRNSSGGK